MTDQDSTQINPTDTQAPMNDGADSATKSGSGKARQLLGMKGADAGETSIWKIRLQLMKPVTWIPLIWPVQVQFSVDCFLETE